VIQLYAQKLKKIVVADELQITPGEVTDSELAVLCDRIKDNPTDILVLGGCRRITDISCLMQLSTISHLDISGCNLGPSGGSHLAGVIKDMGALMKFDISNCHLLAEGGKALAAGLKGNQGLTELNLADNDLGILADRSDYDMSGVIALADAISDMGALLVLNLASNNIGELVPEDGWEYNEEDEEYWKEVTQEQEPPKEMVEVYVDAWEYDEDDEEYWKNITQEQEPPKEMVEVYVDGWEYDEDDGDYWREDEDGELKTCMEEPEKKEKEQYIDGWEYNEEAKAFQKTITQQEEPAKEQKQNYVDGWEYNKASAVYMKTLVQTKKPMTSGAIAIANAIPKMGAIFTVTVNTFPLQIQDIKSKAELDFSGKGLKVEDAVIIAALIPLNVSRTTFPQSCYR
jgi:hypothetical protein